MHNALVNLGDDKMSKSLGNIVSLNEAVRRWDGDTLRLFFLSSHYRSPLTWSEEAIAGATAGADRLRNAVNSASPSGGMTVPGEEARQRFIEAMEDDLNTAQAIAALFDLSREINRGRDGGLDVREAQATLRELAGVLGLTLEAPKVSGDAAPFVDLLVELRRELRAAKQYALADLVRDRLAELHIEVRDGAEGTAWVWGR
jgi:cysteinyl-tRNA synthetase